MHVELDPKSESGGRKGSCKKYAEYLLKDNDYFFNHSSDQISLTDAITLIDSNSKRRLLNTDDKWYAPIYSLSEEEAQHICKVLFSKDYKNFKELSNDEQKIYNAYVVEMAKKFQDKMAASFNLQEKGVTNGSDLFYIGVVENKRLYTGHDDDVKNGIVKSREEKKGFNTHVHIIQSRLANNGRHSKISPLRVAKNKTTNNLGANTGFDRTNFYTEIEKEFDTQTKFKRSEENSFEYQNQQKKVSEDSAKVIENIPVRIRKKFFNKQEASSLVDQMSIGEYVDFLVKKKRFEVVKQKEDRVVYLDKNTNKKYIIYDKGFLCEESKKRGGVVNLIAEVEQLKWIAILNRIIDIKNISAAVVDKKKIELYEVKPAHVDFLFDNNPTYSKILLKNNLQQLRYLSESKRYLSIGLANDKGGITVLSKDKLIYKGERGSSFIEGDPNRNNLIVFSNLSDYLDYLKYKKTTYTRENVLLLNDLNSSNINLNTYDHVISYASGFKQEGISEYKDIKDQILLDRTESVKQAVISALNKMK